jgi:group I intron endonuclease
MSEIMQSIEINKAEEVFDEPVLNEFKTQYIYKITNLINNKIYIGLTNDIQNRFAGHIYAAIYDNPKMLITRAIKKYGKENFKIEHLETLPNLKEGNLAEIKWIKELNSRDKTIGYNFAEGGDKMNQTPEMKAKISSGLLKFYETHDGSNKGKKFTEEWKNNMSISAMGKPGTNNGKTFSEEHTLNMSKVSTGVGKPGLRKFSPEIEKEICDLYVNQHKSMHFLANEYNVYKSRIRAVLLRADIKLRNDGVKRPVFAKRFSDDVEKEICNKYIEGSTKSALTKKYDCSMGAITGLLNRNNVKRG